MRFDNRQNLLLLVTGICVVLFFGDRVVAGPLLSIYSERSTEVSTLRENLSNGTQLLKREESFNQRWSEMKEQSLPVDKAEAESRIQRAVQRWAQASRLNLNNQGGSWREDEDEYLKIEYQATADGDLGQIARFLYEMETDKTVAVRFKDLNLDARDDRGRELSMTLKFTGLALKGDKS